MHLESPDTQVHVDAPPTVETLSETKFAIWNVLFLFLTPLIAAAGLYFYISRAGFVMTDLLIFMFMYFATGLAITVGYHRYYSHRAFECRPWVQLLILIMGAAAWQNSLLFWASNHRYHHRFVDKEGDPYNIKKGFFWAHMGWMFFEYAEKERPFANVVDLKKSRFVAWQHKYYWPLLVLFGFGLPTLIGWMFGRPGAGLLYGGLVRMVVVQQFTFFINSWAHTFGNQPYSDANSAKNSYLLALVSYGEGYHNFHHAYPSDYRNGVAWYHYDPGKWLIWALSSVGQVTKLRRMV